MKTKNNNDEVVTRGVLGEVLAVELDKFATRIETRIEAKIDTKIDTAIGDLAIMVEKGFQAMDERFGEVDKRFDQVDKRFDKVEKSLDEITVELKDVHKEIGINEQRIRADIVSLDFRVDKLEKKSHP